MIPISNCMERALNRTTIELRVYIKLIFHASQVGICAASVVRIKIYMAKKFIGNCLRGTPLWWRLRACHYYHEIMQRGRPWHDGVVVVVPQKGSNTMPFVKKSLLLNQGILSVIELVHLPAVYI